MVTSSLKNYFELNIRDLDIHEVELTIALLNDLNVEAIEERASSLAVFHTDQLNIERIKEACLERAQWLRPEQMTVTSKPAKNWNEIWESSFEPISVNDYCTIRASFHGSEFKTKHVITIDPEMAFGTGHHETTCAMIEAMSHINFKSKRTLDYGCGTGVLAILAEKEGASEIHAIDNDPIAVECALKCIDTNSCAHINVRLNKLIDLSSLESYDIILANINRNILLDNADKLCTLQTPGALLLLSGILSSDKDLIVRTYSERGYQIQDHYIKNEWICLRFVRV